MDEIEPGLWLGSAYAAHDPDLLAKHGISHVVNAAIDVPDTPAFVRKIRLDLHDPDSAENLTTAILKTEEYFQRTIGPVLIHCRLGISRSVAVVAGLLMRKHGWSSADTIAFIESKRPCVCIHADFRAVLENGI
jgi:protein-tyrosine phosphatase